VEQTTFSPVFDYKKVHHVPCVTPEFIKYLKGAIEMQIHVSQHIDPPSVSGLCFTRAFSMGLLSLWPLAKTLVPCGTDHDQVLFTTAATLFRLLLRFFNNTRVAFRFQDRISAANEIVNESIRTGEPVGKCALFVALCGFTSWLMCCIV
jgi:hypothetical protein